MTSKTASRSCYGPQQFTNIMTVLKTLVFASQLSAALQKCCDRPIPASKHAAVHNKDEKIELFVSVVTYDTLPMPTSRVGSHAVEHAET